MDYNKCSKLYFFLYLLQVDLKLSGDVSPLIIGSVRGSEWDAPRVKEATLFILQAYCDSLAVSFHIYMLNCIYSWYNDHICLHIFYFYMCM